MVLPGIVGGVVSVLHGVATWSYREKYMYLRGISLKIHFLHSQALYLLGCISTAGKVNPYPFSFQRYHNQVIRTVSYWEKATKTVITGDSWDDRVRL